MRFFASILAATFFLSGCASSVKVSDHASAVVHREVRLPVEFIPQEKNLCGPTVLKMAADLHRPGVPFETYRQMAFHEKVQGTFKSDMLASARRLGLSPYKVPSLDLMLAQVEQGHPVIVFQNLALSWLPQWHYSLLVGYSVPDNAVYLHSGKAASEKLGFERFVRMWQRGGEWSYIVVPPDQLPPHIPFEEALDNAIVFENLGRGDLAQAVYSSMSRRWPERYEPHLGLANFHYVRKDRISAIEETLLAVAKKPGHPALLYNLAVLYHENGQKTLALKVKEEALAAAPEAERSEYAKKFEF